MDFPMESIRKMIGNLIAVVIVVSTLIEDTNGDKSQWDTIDFGGPLSEFWVDEGTV